MNTKTITFRSNDLGENTNLLLCFVSPTPDLFVGRFPVAWKVANLVAQGPSSFTATYVNAPSFSVAEVDSRRIVSTGNYVPVLPGQETALHVEQNVRPPVYYFSDPTPTGGDLVKATNASGQPVDFGFGFVANLDLPRETVDTTTVIRNVLNGTSITGDFAPVLRAYVGLSYQENEVLGKEIQNIQPVWEADVLSLQPQTTVLIKRSSIVTQPTTYRSPVLANVTPSVRQVILPERRLENTIVQSTYEAVVVQTQRPAVIQTSQVVQPRIEEDEKIYSATIAFPTSTSVVSGVKAIAEQLIAKGYQIKFTYTEGSSNASLDLTLPYATSCEQAEQDLHKSLGGQGPLVGERPRIISRSGSQKVSSGDNFAYWVTINPATQEWFSSQRGQIVLSPNRSRFIQNATRAIGNGINSDPTGLNGTLSLNGALSGAINGALNGALNGGLNGNYLSPNNGARYTKNRPLSRKSSAVSLNGVLA